jgi:hypothetical protein
LPFRSAIISVISGKLASTIPAISAISEAARRNNRRASTCHPERAAAFAANEGPKLAKPYATRLFELLLQTKVLS